MALHRWFLIKRLLLLIESLSLILSVSAFGQERGVGTILEDSVDARPAEYYSTLHALCIGINDYADPGIPDLTYAEEDAVALADILRTEFGFQNTRTLLGESATLSGINNAISDLVSKDNVGSDDGVIIYFSGHGQTIDLASGGEMGFLIPQDAQIRLDRTSDVSEYYRTCIPMREIRNWRDLIPAKHILFIADACYSGLLSTARSIPRPVSDSLRLRAVQVLTAGTRGQKAQEDSALGHGIYTDKLLTALRTGVADLNRDGYIRVSELGQWLRDAYIPGQTPQSRVIDGEGDFILLAKSDMTARLNGYLIDQESKPIESGAVSVIGTNSQDKSDRRGHFSVRLPAGEYIGLEIVLADQKHFTFRKNLSLMARKDFNIGTIQINSSHGPTPTPIVFEPVERTIHTQQQSHAEQQIESFMFKSLVLDIVGGLFNRKVVIKSQPVMNAWSFPVPLTEDHSLNMVYVPGGSFMIGSPRKEDDRKSDEGPQQMINVNNFYISKYEITQAQWQAVLGFNPSHFKDLGGNYPVENVSWLDCQRFCGMLSERTGRNYRLPTEAEWEYACRGRTLTPFSFGPTIMPTIANYDGRFPYGVAPPSGRSLHTTPVGSYHLGNGFGLFDMHGNVSEWCNDTYTNSYEENTPNQRMNEGTSKVVRGGSWNDAAKNLRSASRNPLLESSRTPYIGFRVAISE